MNKLLLGIILTFGIGCTQQNNSAGPATPAATGVETPVPPSSGTQAQGTGHSGGGNGWNNKMLEDYKANPITFAAYEQIVQPLIKELQEVSPTFATEFEFVFKKKLWLMSPEALATIPSKNIGVAIATEQYALQGFLEVWVDKEKYDQMSIDEQATLLVHESLMAIKISRDLEYRKFLEPNYTNPIESIRRKVDGNNIFNIKTTDYEQIRNITVRLLERDHQRNSEQLLKDLETMGFGTYLSVSRLAEINKAYDRPFSAKEVLGFLDTEHKSDSLPTSCQYSVDVTNQLITMTFPSSKQRIHSFSSENSTSTINSDGGVEIVLVNLAKEEIQNTRAQLRLQVRNDRVVQIESSEQVYSVNLGRGSLEWRTNKRSAVNCINKPGEELSAVLSNSNTLNQLGRQSQKAL